MVVFQTYAYSSVQQPIVDPKVANEIAKRFFAKNMHIMDKDISSKISVNQIEQLLGLALTNIIGQSPQGVYKTNPASFSFDWKIPENSNLSILFKSSMDKLYSNDEGDPIKKTLKASFIDKGGKSENFESFYKSFTTMVSYVIVSHARNIPGNLDPESIGFEGKTAHVCSATQCFVLDLMDELNKIAPNVFGRSAPIAKQEQQPGSVFASLSSTIMVLTQSPGALETAYDHRFGKGAYEYLQNNVIPGLIMKFFELLGPAQFQGGAIAHSDAPEGFFSEVSRLKHKDASENSRSSRDKTLEIAGEYRKRKNEQEDEESKGGGGGFLA